MRLWHKDLIPVLPRMQLLGQWQECCMIARNIAANGTPNHLLVNKVMNYPLYHFYQYGVLISQEMKRRTYNCNFDKFGFYFTFPHETKDIDQKEIFEGWHNDRYLWQCYYNLQEKRDCGGITDEEWRKITRYMKIKGTGVSQSDKGKPEKEKKKVI